MIIHELFNWIHNDSATLHLRDQTIERELIEQEELQAKQTNRVLLGKVRLLKYSGTSSTEAIKELDQHCLFMDYLQLYKQEFVKDEKNTVFLIALKSLLSQSYEEQLRLMPKINELFRVLLEDNKESTLSFYDKNKELFRHCTDIQERVAFELLQQKMEADSKSVMAHLEYLHEHLACQENPLGIIALCRNWIGETEKFTALILWLLERKVSVEKILLTNLLQDFLKYHLFTLHSKDNEVSRLYSLLSRFPEAKELVMAAQRISCGELTFLQYSLDGIFQGKNLPVVSQEIPPLQFSLTRDNFTALYRTFGPAFLTAGVATATNHSNEAWLEMLKQTLNQAETLKLLPDIINIIAREYSPKVLKTLADLIAESTAHQLLTLNQSCVFHLLQHKPRLLHDITEENVIEYINHLVRLDTHDQEIIYQLMALFRVLLKKNHPATKAVFEAILDNLVNHAQLLEDEELLTQLKKYPDCELLLEERCEHMQKQLNFCIAEQASGSVFGNHNYNTIEDVWLGALRKFAIIHQINPQMKFSLGHKYALQARIAEAVFINQGDLFDLDNFMDALDLPPVTSSEEISLYERALIEILATIDNEPIRKQIIHKLETTPFDRLDWHEKEYGSQTIFIKAAKKGNLGLINLLEDKMKPSVLNKALRAAAKNYQWETLDHLFSLPEVELNLDEIDNLVAYLAEHGRVESVKKLLKLYDYKPSTELISAILKKAIANDNLQVIMYFCKLPVESPKQSTLDRLFKLAIQLQHWDIVKYLANSKHYSPSQTTLEKAFQQTALAMQHEAVEILGNVEKTPVRAIVIERALLKASKLGHTKVVQSICTLPSELLTKQAIEDALEQAAAQGHLDIVSCLCEPETTRLRQPVINSGMKIAVQAGKLSVVNYFCSMTGSNKPTPRLIDQTLVMAAKKGQTAIFRSIHSNHQTPPGKHAIEQAFQLAITTGKLPILDYLCRHDMYGLNQSKIDQALISAVKSKQLEIVYYLCESLEITPSRNALRVAVSKAISSDQSELADYLRSRASSKSKLTDTTVDEMDSPCEIGKQLATNGLFKYKRKDDKEPSLLLNPSL
ncbi:ankyrin repeat domain-containing protein [Legionella pneumophila]|uniref:Ankyrin repeat protein n=1 Tax=Legionella pneumophila subsp. pascullei TaxID=91890 RepID=A0AAX2ISF6_LEGPN|nr:ankyrin repeat domain-containing protein [Legionella pneumophila]AMP88280.1 hypothetical protein AXF35_00580 [Legionella pneumophila subsp. pascullei]AMP91189.1 hypothetical protein AXF36_00580 [Legionella pneumophila subsp. pascullei]AMP94176.1 hypothetical protein AXF37_00580 [Legionella pneumophila subsp. pascullei]SQG88949.1 ankyrin repeat protein [Legionella pneumophila subsp. pascullei]VEH03999.1 ankyrin repeat protein [Legionella pneumophila subsp. pascullei]